MGVLATRHQIGVANTLIEVQQFQDWMEVARVTAFKILRALQIPLTYIGKKAFFNLHTLNRVIYYLSRLNGEGFVAPGSYFKSRNNYRKFGPVKLEITDKDLQKMEDPVFVAEWLAAGSTNPARGALFVQTLKEKKAENAKERDAALQKATSK